MSDWSSSPREPEQPDESEPVEVTSEASPEASPEPEPTYLEPASMGDVGVFGSDQGDFEEMAFDLAAVAEDDRHEIASRLTDAGVAFRIEDATDLIVRTEDATLVQGMFAEVIGTDTGIEAIDEADADEDEIVFDLAALSTEERSHLSMRLRGAGIAFIWEVGTDLVVSVEDAPVIESYVAEVRNPDGFADDEIASFEEDDGVDDEQVYAAMSNLYVAADRLLQRPGDEPTVGTFYLAADDVEGLPAPFGFDPRVWSQVLGLTSSIISALDADGDTDTIGDNAKALRQLLVNYV